MTALKPLLAASLVGSLMSGAAFAQTLPDTRTVFCAAVRTVPLLDQNNYVMGHSGTVYMTPNFETSLTVDEVNYKWNGFIGARHKVVSNDNPDDACRLAIERRDWMRTFIGNVNFRSVKWPQANGK
ncbi:MAG: hypothetical protein CFE28_03525 [Alphaproteobacteria bacterium PA2]|nr:MAG: hypothetical protein CFE28_03525 [Alphaproteobacteria bacterium PA2]